MPDPHSVKTPFTDQIQSLYEEYNEIKSSKTIQDAMYNYVKADLVSTTIDTYLKNMMLEQSGHELNTEKLLLQANELIKASAEEAEKANQKFLDGEKVYKRLREAK